MYSLDGKKILIIGAKGGIGTEITKHFMNHNCELFLTGSTNEGIKSFCDSLDKEHFKGKIHHSGLDLSKKEEVLSIVDRVIQQMEHIDVLVCNAGCNADNLSIRMSEDSWEKIININLNANFFINRDVLKTMFKRGCGGKVINISSIVASTGNFGQSNYCASKAGLEGMTRALATEFASRNININCIAPGFIDTEMTKKIPANIKEKMLVAIPCKRYGYPSEIAKVVLFLASDDASYINGQVIHVNGGMLMK